MLILNVVINFKDRNTFFVTSWDRIKLRTMQRKYITRQCRLFIYSAIVANFIPAWSLKESTFVARNLKTYYMWLSVITLRYGINSENETNQTNVKFCVNVTCLNACFGVVIHVSVYMYSVSALSIYYIHVYPFRKIAILILEYSTVRSRVFVVYMFSWYFECTVYNADDKIREI